MPRSPAIFIVDGNPERIGLSQTISELIDWACSRGYKVALPAMLRPFVRPGQCALEQLTVFESRGDIKQFLPASGRHAGLILSMGGDGSVLHAVGRYWDFGLPFMGVNLGSVGFNSPILPQQLAAALGAWEADQLEEDEHMLLRVRHLRGEQVVAEAVALNDVVLHRELHARILQLEVRQGGSRVLSCYGDGAIVATPTGSTAYSLSAGGPIVHPALNAFVITTLGAHTLSNRPIVLPPIELGLIWRARPSNVSPMVMVDGLDRWQLESSDEIRVAREEKALKLVRLAGTDYFETLREKLRWALPIRALDDGT